ncbi:MAG: hypothetical protein KDB07_06175, partial [Planctomycetes bacterium]|nr:hypothetical protein [Planctomycetota bacterium]
LGVRMILHIGEASSELIAVDGADLLAMRSISYGVRDIVKSIAGGLGVNMEQARQLTLKTVNIAPGYSGENPSGEAVVRHGQDAVSRLFLQIRAAEGYIKAVTGRFNLSLDQVAVCGTGAVIRGLPEFLAHRYQKKVSIFNPLAGFDFGDMGGNERALVGQHGVAMAIGLGLAKIAADRGRAAAVIDPPSVVARRHFFDRSLWLYAAVGVLVLALGFTFLYSMNQANQSRELRDVVRELEQEYGAAHTRIAEGAGQALADSPYATFQGLSELERETMTVEQMIREGAQLSIAGAAARRVQAHIPTLLGANMTLESYLVEQGEYQGKKGLVGRLTVSYRPNANSSNMGGTLKSALEGHPDVASVVLIEDGPGIDLASSVAKMVIYFKAPTLRILGESK